MDMTGWECIFYFVEAAKRLLPYKRAYLESRKEIRFKFGFEAVNNPKHALKLDLKGGNKLWKEAIKAE